MAVHLRQAEGGTPTHRRAMSTPVPRTLAGASEMTGSPTGWRSPGVGSAGSAPASWYEDGSVRCRRCLSWPSAAAGERAARNGCRCAGLETLPRPRPRLASRMKPAPSRAARPAWRPGPGRRLNGLVVLRCSPEATPATPEHGSCLAFHSVGMKELCGRCHTVDRDPSGSGLLRRLRRLPHSLPVFRGLTWLTISTATSS
jgi:hypothetical protein